MNRFYKFLSLIFKIIDGINFVLTRWTFRNGLLSEVFDDAFLVKDVLAYQFNCLLMSVDRIKTHYAVIGDAFA